MVNFILRIYNDNSEILKKKHPSITTDKDFFLKKGEKKINILKYINR